MKKFIALTLALALLASLSFAVAEAPGGDLGIQIIGGPEAESVPMSLDDMQLGTTYTIDGYATVKPIEYLVVDCFAQFGENEDYSVWHNEYASASHVFTFADSNFNWQDYRYTDASWMDSGSSAQFIWLRTDVTNLTKSDVSFDEDAAVKLVYESGGEEYEFTGWVRQINYDNMEKANGDGNVSRYNYDKSTYPPQIVMNPAKNAPVSMMYTGNYVFGCTVPNTVVEDKTSPLRMEIKLGENDLTYNIRK